MMRKSNLGSSSVQRPGALKPRNSNTTPNNRRSAGQQIRKSHLPKPSQPDSAKRLTGRAQRISAEGIGRLSLASGRFTPTRNNALPPSVLAAPPSVSRLSMDSVRNSSMGGKARKETRPITDSSFKSQCVDKILDFLASSGYEYQLQRRTLLTPSTKDFSHIFSFIYRHLDPQYNLPNRFEEEIPRLLKLLKYPVQMPKSSFITVGSPHTWPSVLAMLAWLVDVVNAFQNIDPVPIAFPSDFDSDVNLSKARFTTMVELAYCDDEEKFDAQLEEYRHLLEEAQRVRPQDMLQIQEEDERLEDMVSNLGSGPERLQQLQHQYNQLVDDSDKMSDYCRELQVHISAKDGERARLESKLSEVKAVQMQVFEEVSRLETLKGEQALNVAELARFKNHAHEVATIISQLQSESKDLDSQIWSLEMEVGKAQSNLCESIYAYNKLVRELDLPEDYEISSVDIADSIHNWETSLLDDLRTRKKNAKHAMFEAQNHQIRKEEEITMVNEMVQEKRDQMSMLESKLRRVEEDIMMTKNEIAAEEKEMQDESERLHQQIIEARKAHKGSLYQKQCALEQAKEKLENVKTSGKERMRAGAEFLVRVCHSALDQLEWQQKEAVKHKISVENMTHKISEALHTE